MANIAQSDRVHLRVPTLDDFETLADLWSDPVTMRYIGSGDVWSHEKTRERIKAAGRAFLEHKMCFFTAVLKDGTIIGQGGIVPIAFNGPEYELGYRLGRAHWGQGFATEIARLSADYAFNTVGLDRLVAVSYPDNIASRRVLEKTGFTQTGLSDVYYSVLCATYELRRENWS